MYRYIVSFIICFSLYFSTYSQTEPLFSVSLSELGPGYEMPVNRNLTAKIQLGFYGTSLTEEIIGNNSYTMNSYFFFHPGGQASLRYYYNFNRRNDLGKNTNRNSANYFGLMNMFLSKPFTYLGPDCGCTDLQGNPVTVDPEIKEMANRGLTTGLVWGMQRNYERRFSLDLSFGMGYSFRQSMPILLASTTVGFWLGKRY